MNNGPTPQANRATALWQLILTRNREFLREPAAVFWVYVFPLLMTFTLGLAFRAEPTESYFVTVVDSPQGKAAVAKLEADEEKRFQVELLDYETARNRLRTGKTELVLIPNDADSATDSDEANSKSDNENREASSAYRPILPL